MSKPNKWRISLFNQHAQCGYSADGPSRPVAFARVYLKAGPRFLLDQGDYPNEKQLAPGTIQDRWEAAFRAASALIGKRYGNSYPSRASRQDGPFIVEIERI
jgi:hypothetical protein